MLPGSPARTPARMGIGEVLRRLKEEFPDVSISKIRFLEAEGLIEPERTASGYRKFNAADLERLRYILAAQRDHYLPLRVIREHLDAIARGLEPSLTANQPPRAPAQALADDGDGEGDDTGAPPIRMSRAELLANSGLSEPQLRQLDEFGFIAARPGTGEYDATALAVATAAAALSSYGLEPRHLRLFKTAADRQAGLIDQVVSPVARQRSDDAPTRADDLRRDLGRVAARLHAALLSQALAGLR